MQLYIDPQQGHTNGQAYGYIGTHDTDEDGLDYCGWFFDWPCTQPVITTPEEQQIVLERDETCRHLTAIPADRAYRFLEAYLDKTFAAKTT